MCGFWDMLFAGLVTCRFLTVSSTFFSNLLYLGLVMFEFLYFLFICVLTKTHPHTNSGSKWEKKYRLFKNQAYLSP